jgi:hypothetical protein
LTVAKGFEGWASRDGGVESPGWPSLLVAGCGDDEDMAEEKDKGGVYMTRGSSRAATATL